MTSIDTSVNTAAVC